MLLEIVIYPSADEMSRAAASEAAKVLRETLASRPVARFVAATGMSQLKMLTYLAAEPGIDWKRTEMFHLDEYTGIDDKHPASFRRYLRENFVSKIKPSIVHWLDGDANYIESVCNERGDALTFAPVHLALVGIGENGHLAFNDPPADFETQKPFLIVELDVACRKQQVGEGWFASIDEVPTHAITMSINAILRCEHIICTVPDERKAQAVADCLAPGASVSPHHPASILKTHVKTQVFLDEAAASLLKANPQ